MKIIISHTNLDFDGLASMIGVKKLNPYGEMILPEKLSPDVEQFLAIYKDTFPFKRAKSINWQLVREIIVVDTNRSTRLGEIKKYIRNDMEITVFDHHPPTSNPLSSKGIIKQVGSATTIIAEILMEKNIKITPFEATVFALGIYSDTGAFTFNNTTANDLKVAAWLFDKGANLSVVEQFRQLPLSKDASELFQVLLDQGEVFAHDGLEIFVCSFGQDHYTGHLAYITRKLLDITGNDAVIAVVKMEEKVFITSRASSDRINLLPIIQDLGGGGHPKAASAMQKNAKVTSIVEHIKENLSSIVSPSITAQHLMTSPVRVVAPETEIEVVSKMLYRYGHTGFPVVAYDRIVGIISRRDVDKALHHGLGHAPVKGYMSRQPITINKSDSIETIQDYMIDENVGRLPVIEDGEIIGIVSRTDVIRAMHGKNKFKVSISLSPSNSLKRNLVHDMREQLPDKVFDLLKLISSEANEMNMKAYLIGGMVRDLLLGRRNEDMDIVIEGDSIALGKALQQKYGGQLRSHEEFRTATWKHPSDLKIDLTSARTEYYDFPAALPKVEMSTIKEDLLRRDFSINAMGISLDKGTFGELIDYFHGYEDLMQGKIKVLYNLSFVEDPTRILRAIRFESRFDFFMDVQTEALARESANNLLSLSKPRIANELRRVFFEENPLYGVDRLYTLGLPAFLFKNCDIESNVKKKYERLHHAVETLHKSNITISSAIWVAYMLYFTRLTEEDFKEVELYCLTKHDYKLLSNVQSIKEKLSIIKQPLRNIGKWHELFSTTETESLLTVLPLLELPIYQQGVEYLLAREKFSVMVNGTDLINNDFKPGPHFKELLLYGEILQLNNPEIEKQDIIKEIKQYFKNNNMQF